MVDIIKLCEYLYNSMHFPIYIYNDTRDLIAHFPKQKNDTLPASEYLSRLWNIYQVVSYIEISAFSYYGCVKVKNSGISIIIGPINPLPYTKDTLFIMHKDFLIEDSKKESFNNFLYNIPTRDLDDFINDLLLINYMTNNTQISPTDIIHISNPLLNNDINSKYYEKVFSSIDENLVNTNYEIEKELYDYIEAGNIKKLDMFYKNISYANYDTGTTSSNYLRHKKNNFITGISLITRAAIRGGFPPNSAYRLSDIYLQQIEPLSDASAVDSLLIQATYDYANRVAKFKIPIVANKLFYEVSKYVNENVYKDINVSDVAKYLHFNRSYLSHRFKSEFGMTLGKYIQSCKLEESENLLKYSNKSISEISSLLCFSSQSHFQNAFKKKLGVTPQTYRNSEHRTNKK
ncbi:MULTISPECIES: helix-turn-helix domain-containing protein [unclassified Clostridium]|uniref:helix-turn-helix domain-containing protein n=1 Tax=unclassified Clostridium TaxID=2614128 RepID=UPI001EEDEB8B|nr:MULTISPECIES: helix-turn-helix domain-containing protein [unclassified Clostridium]